MSIGGNKAKTSSSSNQQYSGSSQTSYTPGFQNQLQQRLDEIGGRQYQTLDPNAYKQFMDPYHKDVVDSTMAQLDQTDALARTRLQGDQAGSGAFGNDRRGVYQAELANGQGLNRASILSGLNSRGYQQAVGLAQGENSNANAFQGQQDGYINQLLALLAQGNQVTTNSGTQSGTSKGSQSQFEFQFNPFKPKGS